MRLRRTVPDPNRIDPHASSQRLVPVQAAPRWAHRRGHERKRWWLTVRDSCKATLNPFTEVGR